MVLHTSGTGFNTYFVLFFRTGIFILLLFLFIKGQSQTVFPGEFQRLKTLGDVRVELIPSTENKAEYVIERGFDKDLEVSVKEDWLTIRVKAPENSKYNRPVTKASVKLYYKELREINIAALSDVSTRDTLVSPFLKISGSKGSRGRLNIKSFDLSVHIQNKGTIYLSGKTETIKVQAFTNSVLEAGQLVAKEANLTADQNAMVNIFCEKAVYGKVSSGARVKCFGNPMYKNVEESGGSFKAVDP
jgi:hypothetical protein